MAARTRGRIADAIVGVFIVIVILSAVMNRAPRPIQSEFAQSVDLPRLSNIAVQHNGRLKSFDSFARSMMKFVSGPRSVNGQSSTFTYFDLMFRPQAYREADIIYVKHKDMRGRIVQALAGDPSVSRGDLARCQEVGLFSLVSLARPEVDALLDDMSRDLIRTAKFVDMVRDAQVVSRPEMLSANLRIVPPAGDDPQLVWFSIDRLWRSSGAPGDSIHAGMTARAKLPGLDQKLQDGIADGWMRLGSAWRQQDAAAVNGILGANQPSFMEKMGALFGENPPAELTDENQMGYFALSPELLADQVVFAINQPWGVSISDLTVRASGDGYTI